MKDCLLYVLGTSPYDNCNGDYRTKGNGEWHTEAADLKEAPQVSFSSMSFPAEPTGRNIFVPGVSLEGVHEDNEYKTRQDAQAALQPVKYFIDRLNRKYNGLIVHWINFNDLNDLMQQKRPLTPEVFESFCVLR